MSSLPPSTAEAAIGFEPSRGEWVTPVHQGAGCVPLPVLEGALLVSPQALREAEEDFGHVMRRRPSAILRPGSSEDVARMVRFARQHRLKIGPRGQAHTLYGQSQVEGGIVIDMRALAEIHSVGEDWIDVGAGILWSELVARTFAAGKTPPVLTDYLDLSVGGTLSVGGVGGSSYQHGLQVDNVLALQVVTGEGEQVVCSPTEHRELFEAMLAGLGQCGIIVRATLRLVPAPTHIRLYDLGYADAGTMLRDELTLIADARFDYVLALVLATPKGWAFRLQGLAYHTPPKRPDDERLLEGLSYQRGTEQLVDLPFLQWVNRIAPQITELRSLNQYTRPHPWCDLLVPASRIEGFLGEVLQEVAPAEITDFFPMLMYPLKRGPMTRPLFRVPEEDTFFLLDILRTGGPDTKDAVELVAHNRRLFERNRSWGGTHYTISAFERSPQDWREHFGPAWRDFEAAKRRHDPDNVLTPGPGIFR